jgi:hypothetical protein
VAAARAYAWAVDLDSAPARTSFSAAGAFRADEARNLATRGALIHPNEE